VQLKDFEVQNSPRIKTEAKKIPDELASLSLNCNDEAQMVKLVMK